MYDVKRTHLFLPLYLLILDVNNNIATKRTQDIAPDQSESFFPMIQSQKQSNQFFREESSIIFCQKIRIFYPIWIKVGLENISEANDRPILKKLPSIEVEWKICSQIQLFIETVNLINLREKSCFSWENFSLYRFPSPPYFFSIHAHGNSFIEYCRHLNHFRSVFWSSDWVQSVDLTVQHTDWNDNDKFCEPR